MLEILVAVAFISLLCLGIRFGVLSKLENEQLSIVNQAATNRAVLWFQEIEKMEGVQQISELSKWKQFVKEIDTSPVVKKVK